MWDGFGWDGEVMYHSIRHTNTRYGRLGKAQLEREREWLSAGVACLHKPGPRKRPNTSPHPRNGHLMYRGVAQIDTNMTMSTHVTSA